MRPRRVALLVVAVLAAAALGPRTHGPRRRRRRRARHGGAATGASELKSLEEPKESKYASPKDGLDPKGVDSSKDVLKELSSAAIRLPLAALLGGARAAPAAPGNAAAPAASGPDPDRPRHRGLGDHARRRCQPRARVRHRRRREPGPLPVEDRRSQGCGGDALRALASALRRAWGSTRLPSRPLSSCSASGSSRASSRESGSSLTVKLGKETAALRPRIETILRRIKADYELRGVREDEVPTWSPRRRHSDRPRLDPMLDRASADGKGAVEWAEGSQAEIEMKLIVQPDAGVAPSSTRSGRAEDDRHRDLPARPQGGRAGPRRGRSARRQRARADRPHQSRGEARLRKLEQRLLADGIMVTRTGGRPAPLSRQVHDRRRGRSICSASTSPSSTSTRAAASRSPRATPHGEGCREAVRGRQHAPGVHALRSNLVVSPESARDQLSAFIKGRAEASWRSTTSRSRTRG